MTAQRRREISIAKAKAAEHDEIQRISAAYHRNRKTKARERYMKLAMQRKGYARRCGEHITKSNDAQ